MSYKLIDLFAGAGGLTQGFFSKSPSSNFECVFGIDNDKAAVLTHNKNFGPHSLCADIEDWLKLNEAVPKADVVIGGPPCQGFSLLNKKREGDLRRALWEPYMDVVERSKASIFIVENVQGLFRSPELVNLRARAKNLGFETCAAVLNSADYGAPQVRKRTIVVGWHPDRAGSPVEFPPPKSHGRPGDDSRLMDWKTVRDAIGDLIEPVGTEIRNCPPPLDLHFGRNPTAKSMKRYIVVPPGGNRFDLARLAPEITPNCWLKKKTGSTDLFGRLWWDRPSVTIRTEFFKPEKGRYLHPEKHRPITHREAARLMGFPDEFLFVGSKIEIARQIGNAVPPPLAYAIAKMVTEMLSIKRSKKVA